MHRSSAALDQRSFIRSHESVGSGFVERLLEQAEAKPLGRLRQNNRLQYGQEQIEITQKHLADFRRENSAKEGILRQQRTDRETRAALKVLEGGKHMPTASAISPIVDVPTPSSVESAPQEKKPDKLLVFKRIRT